MYFTVKSVLSIFLQHFQCLISGGGGGGPLMIERAPKDLKMPDLADVIDNRGAKQMTLIAGGMAAHFSMSLDIQIVLVDF